MRPLAGALVLLALTLALTAACARARPNADPAHGALAAAAGGVTSAVAAAGDPRAFRVVPLESFPGDVQLLFGHPDSAGPFVMRIKELAGTVVPPHSHPVDEHITVVRGTWYFGLGERFDSTALRPIGPGGYAFAPAGATMFAYAPEAAVVQVHGTGPFHIHWRDGSKVLGEPGAEGTFRFGKGEAVVTPRGAGRVRQGYASGALVQYEIEPSAGGETYMANERDLRRP
jgi:hypothetical protein